MTPDELLTTTRTVRKRLDLDRPVPLSLIRECLEIAIQAPTASNSQSWHFVVVQHPEQRAEIAKLYKKAFAVYRNTPVSVHALAELRVGEEKAQMERVLSSAEYLTENIERVPVFVIPCLEGRVDAMPPPVANVAQASAFASIYPATWSFMLAARLRGLGSALTTVHLVYEREAAKILGIPYDQVTQTALLAVGYLKGDNTFKKAPRRPLDAVLHIDDW